jgi:hypothetical protein
MSTEPRATLDRFTESHDPQFLTDDALFRDTSSGQDFRGRDAIGQMLDWFYHIAFDAHVEDGETFLSEDGSRAAFRGRFVGTHIGEFAGIPATGRPVDVPLAVIYTINDDKISGAEIYFQAAVAMRQLTAEGAPA